MENKKQNPSMKKELQKTMEEITQVKREKLDEWKTNPYVKAGMYLSGALLLVWASQFVFSAFEGAIKQYKKLKRTLNEK
jgi:hypothetical protein